jgi:Thiol:disulfide interchange protein DsbD, N-terminal
MTKRAETLTAVVVFFASLGFAQAPGDKQPYVTLAPVGNVQVRAGATTGVELDFRIGSEFHINSHHPRADYLIPTALKLNAPEQLTVADVKYPAGEEMTFPFSPNEKLSVYSGDFSINAVLKAPANTAAGKYPVKGELRFQACDHSACYPPHSIPVQFQVTVVKK